MSDDVLVAIIAAVGVIGAAGFGFLGVVVQNLRKSIGEPNGHGNLVQMAEKLLAGQAGQDRRLAKLEHGQAEHAQRLDRVERQVSDLAS